MSKSEARKAIKRILDKLDPWDAAAICDQFSKAYGVRALGYTSKGRPEVHRG